MINNLYSNKLGTRELLTYLEKLEIGLSSFSYEELGVVEAGELKKSFEVFKIGLENKVFGVSEMKQLESIYEKVGIQSLDNRQFTESESSKFLTLIKALENTPLSKEQSEIVKELKNMVHGTKRKAQNSDKTTDSMSTDFEFIEKSLQAGFANQSIDLKPVLEDCMGQMELLEELVRMFKQNVWEFIGNAKINLLNENFSALELACQKVMPSLRMMKTYGLLEATQQVSRLCKTDKDLKHLAFLYDQFLQEYPRVQEQIDFEMEMYRTM
ncbi:hypothetical protein D2V08_16770 [Flagellimonas lutimaris]|uniref:Uncharacterized protein n=1 Tax=Flagellimonas lutimaris TaxID=475082 RepID=A0A3A1N3J5_9FLAO|nr:hypothetical protein [Allomuricauda lutimaris]RIV30725.1 hypothetical protein D2V08_16770 [Allomuricauda lutimaris]|tara:strand:+ start:395 stop:1201 length:807 start_codon:yes stop_codon:yes gene_type:complete